ncbi:hypothetical protein L208DRAFT_1408116 [Tricholoma matsutake]|nr:hypothetical protein L208DRAFT_1408116 [Tricholoma matsutake 945]
MRRAAWVHLLAAYLSIGSSATPVNATPGLHSPTPPDSLSNVRSAWSSNSHPRQQFQDEEKQRPSLSSPRRYVSSRRRRAHP